MSRAADQHNPDERKCVAEVHSLGMRGAIPRSGILLLCLILSGCVDPVAPTDPTKPTPDRRPAPVNSQSLEDVAYQSFQQRDLVRAKKLRAIRGAKYDANRQKLIEQAGADASRETWKPVADALAAKLDRIPQDDQAAFDAVLEELAKGSERAGK